MTSGVRVLCRSEVAPGLALTGVPVEAVDTEGAASAALELLLGRRDTGAVLVEEGVYRALPDEVRRRADRSTHPVVVPFPSPTWAPAPTADEYVVELLRRAIGYRVRLG